MIKIKRISLMEMVVSIFLFLMVLSALRFMMVDLTDYSNNVEHNISTLNKMRDVITLISADSKKSYRTVIEPSKVSFHTVSGIIEYENKESAFFKNGLKLFDIKGFDFAFEDASAEVNGGNGKKVLKLNFSYIQKEKKTENTYTFSKYLGVLEN